MKTVKYRCLDCGLEFETPAHWEEYRGECHGVPAYETVYGCPMCDGDYEEIDEEEENEDECD